MKATSPEELDAYRRLASKLELDGKDAKAVFTIANLVINKLDQHITELQAELEEAGFRLQRADERSEALEAQAPRWVAVDERLPTFGDVEVVCQGEQFSAYYGDDGWILKDCPAQWPVSHWLESPVPKPPNTEEG